MGAGSTSGAAVFVTGARGTVTNSGWINGQAYGVELEVPSQKWWKFAVV
jgi:hypothetical protein